MDEGHGAGGGGGASKLERRRDSLPSILAPRTWHPPFCSFAGHPRSLGFDPEKCHATSASNRNGVFGFGPTCHSLPACMFVELALLVSLFKNIEGHMNLIPLFLPSILLFL